MEKSNRTVEQKSGRSRKRSKKNKSNGSAKSISGSNATRDKLGTLLSSSYDDSEKEAGELNNDAKCSDITDRNAVQKNAVPSELTDEKDKSNQVAEKKEKETPTKQTPLSPSTKTDPLRESLEGSKIPTSKCEVPILDNLTAGSDRKNIPHELSKSPLETDKDGLNKSAPVSENVHVLTVNSVRTVDTQSISTGGERTHVRTDVSADEIAENVLDKATGSVGTRTTDSRSVKIKKDSTMNGGVAGAGGHEEKRGKAVESHEAEDVSDAVHEDAAEEEEVNVEEEEEEVEVEENYEEEENDEIENEIENEGLEIDVDDDNSRRRDKKYFTGSYYESDTNSDNTSRDRERVRARTADSEGTMDDFATASGCGALFYDEWENDDDPGYIFVQLSEEEFFTIVEEEALQHSLRGNVLEDEEEGEEDEEGRRSAAARYLESDIEENEAQEEEEDDKDEDEEEEDNMEEEEEEEGEEEEGYVGMFDDLDEAEILLDKAPQTRVPHNTVKTPLLKGKAPAVVWGSGTIEVQRDSPCDTEEYALKRIASDDSLTVDGDTPATISRLNHERNFTGSNRTFENILDDSASSEESQKTNENNNGGDFSSTLKSLDDCSVRTGVEGPYGAEAYFNMTGHSRSDSTLTVAGGNESMLGSIASYDFRRSEKERVKGSEKEDSVGIRRHLEKERDNGEGEGVGGVDEHKITGVKADEKNKNNTLEAKQNGDKDRGIDQILDNDDSKLTREGSVQSVFSSSHLSMDSYTNTLSNFTSASNYFGEAASPDGHILIAGREESDIDCRAAINSHEKNSNKNNSTHDDCETFLKSVTSAEAKKRNSKQRKEAQSLVDKVEPIVLESDYATEDCTEEEISRNDFNNNRKETKEVAKEKMNEKKSKADIDVKNTEEEKKEISKNKTPKKEEKIKKRTNNVPKGDFGILPPHPPSNIEVNRRRSDVLGQHSFKGVDGKQCYFNLKVIFDPYRTGFEDSKTFTPPKGTIIAGRYEVTDVLGQAAFSTALQCIDLLSDESTPQWVCLKVIKNSKDFFDQSLDEIKLLQYINAHGDADEHNVLKLLDFFYCKEHLFIVSELLRNNLYEFGRFVRESGQAPYFTIPRLKKVMFQTLKALEFVHGLRLIHCDIKPENIVIKSFSRCEIKLIDFGSSCFVTDHLTSYIQSRSYRAPEVILGHPYDGRIDIWSVGCVLAEMHTGYVLFQNDSIATMLSRITGILGPFPPKVLAKGKETIKYFTLSNVVYEKTQGGTAANAMTLIYPKHTNLPSRLHCTPLPYNIPHPESPKKIKQKTTSPYSRRNIEAEFNRSSRDTARNVGHTVGWRLSDDEELFVDFVSSLLDLDPNTRPTATQALNHPWLANLDQINLVELNEQRESAIAAKQAEMMAEEREARAERRERRRNRKNEDYEKSDGIEVEQEVEEEGEGEGEEGDGDGDEGEEEEDEEEEEEEEEGEEEGDEDEER